MTAGDSGPHPARYYDGRTARPQDVAVRITADGISIYRAGSVFIASWGAARLVLAEKPRPGEPVRIGLEGTTARLIVENPGGDGGIVDALLAIAPRAARSIRTSRKAVLRVAGWAAAAAAAAAAIVLVLIPLLAEQLAAQTPPALKQRIGAATLEQIVELIPYLPGEDQRARFCAAPDGLAVLGRLAGRISSGLAPAPALRLSVIDANLVNAFALPGGYVVVTSGLLNAAESPEEVAGVLAHEIGHAAYAHPTQAIFRTTAVSLLISAVIGDFTGGVLIAGVAEWALNSSYTREAERDADRFAMARLNAAGIDGRGLERFFTRLMEEAEPDADERPAGKRSTGDDPLRFLSTHPPTAERIAYIRDNARGTGPAMTAADWQKLQSVCRAKSAGPPPFPPVAGG